MKQQNGFVGKYHEDGDRQQTYIQRFNPFRER
jgi:hypothetical protein